jgi:hypothetical protein
MMHAESIKKPLKRVDLFLSQDGWKTIKKLARAQEITASEWSRRVLDTAVRLATSKQNS